MNLIVFNDVTFVSSACIAVIINTHTPRAESGKTAVDVYLKFSCII